MVFSFVGFQNDYLLLLLIKKPSKWYICNVIMKIETESVF